MLAINGLNKTIPANVNIEANRDNIEKNCSLNSFEDDSSCLGYTIDVFQESINKPIPEFLVNYDYFNRIMENYGFQLINSDEAK